MATFTALANIYFTEYFCNTKVAGLGEIFVQRKFCRIRYIYISLIYRIARNIGGELNLVVWRSAFATAKFKSANILQWRFWTQPPNLRRFPQIFPALRYTASLATPIRTRIEMKAWYMYVIVSAQRESLSLFHV